MRLIFCILIIFPISFCHAQTEETPYQEKTFSSKAEKKKFYDQLSAKYSSADIQNIWKSDAKEQIFSQWVDGSKELELVDEYGTVIHELSHGMDNHENNGRNYNINKDIVIFVPITDVYLSTELNKVVRKGQQDSIFRYGIYIGGKNVLPDGTKTSEINTSSGNQPTSIQEGIYGLMDEFDAYYNDVRASFELYDYFFEKNWKDDDAVWKDYKHMVAGQAVAYYEFRLFMGWYLLHAKKKHPEKYKEIQNNNELRVVFTLMNDKFSALLDSVDLRFKIIDGFLDEKKEKSTDLMGLKFDDSDEDKIKFAELLGITKEMGIYEVEKKTVGGKEVVKLKILDEENFEVIETSYQQMLDEFKSMSTSNGNTSDDLMLFYADPKRQVEYLKKQFTKELNEELKKLRIEGVTEKNYKDFLK